MFLRRILFALTVAAFISPVASLAAKPTPKPTHKAAAKKCVSTKKVHCPVGGAAPSHP
jgi:hypothetical protein